tara:strand:+ start:32975 stop:36322 length:3348 start_codon:yes stop_codon:yes gene_type:complete
MAEQTFKSAGFFDFETEISRSTSAASGVPLAVIGTAEKGPAFNPVYFGLPAGASTVGEQLRNFTEKFGSISPTQFGPYAVKAWFEQGVSFSNITKSCQYLRVLGAGANSQPGDFTNTGTYGIVKSAGFKVNHPNPFALLDGAGGPSVSGDHRITHGGQRSVPGTTYFLAARHEVPATSDTALPHFTDNDSFKGVSSSGADDVNLIRAMIFTPTGSALLVADYDSVNIETPTNGIGAGIFAAGQAGLASGSVSTKSTSLFKLLVSSSDGATFATTDGNAGVKIFTCSLNPDEDEYIGNVLNTDPLLMASQGHYLYIDWPVTNVVAPVKTDISTIALLSGSSEDPGVGLSAADDVPATLLNQYQNMFGRFDTRYSTAKTPYIISQPFGKTEHNLFYFENLSDGAAGNTNYYISIENVKASTDPANLYGTFDVVLHSFPDTAGATSILERYSRVSLNPDAKNYIGKAIGDFKSTYNFDTTVDKRRFSNSGANPLKSNRIRVVVAESVKRKLIPPIALPFGFRGIPTIKTSPSIRDCGSASDAEAAVTENIALGDVPRLAPFFTGSIADFAANDIKVKAGLTGSIVPPLPFRFKQAKTGDLKSSPSFIGQPGPQTATDATLNWGVQFENQRSETKPWEAGSADLDRTNGIIKSYAKFQGISKLNTVYTGSAVDKFNNNKFTLARVALVNQLNATNPLQDITGSASDHIKDAAYIRNGVVDGADYTVYDRVLDGDRISLATLLAKDKKKYNKFSSYAKFNTIFYGGFDGLNIFDRDAYEMNDKASSTEAGGFARDIVGGTGITGSDNGTLMGKGINNSIIQSYRSAIDIINDRYQSIHHILNIPGIREPLITDYASERTEDYQMAMYVMDIPNYDESGNRLFIDSTVVPSVVKTVSKFEARDLDNSYTATYFPDVIIDDPINGNRRTEVPASIAAVTAYSYSDSSKGGSVWFAPAGFDRGSLSPVKNTTVRLTTLDRDDLYEAKINPIANFPVVNPGFVEYKIWGQKTLQLRQSALDRVNVRRMLLEVKRQILQISRRLLFKRNNPQLRTRFISALSPKLSFIQLNQGIESFRIIMDDSNNTALDQKNYKLNGKVIIVPTRTIEFVSIDFIIDPDGVTFQ